MMNDLPVLTRVCDDTIAELEHLHRQDQAKITELQLQLEKEKEATRNALADRAQVTKQLAKVREANEQLAEQCKENDALKAQNTLLDSLFMQGFDCSINYDEWEQKVKQELSRSPKHCLAELKASTIEDLIQHMHDEYNGESMDQFFQAYADQLREGAKDA